MQQLASVNRIFKLHAFDSGRGFHGYGLRDPQLAPTLDPFLSVDHFKMSRPTFAPHPHAGFSAVTYLFEDSETPFINRDSLGHQLEIAPGALQWTRAAAGMMHEELPRDVGKTAHGLQIFVNLAAARKYDAPAAYQVNASQMPVFVSGGARARVAFGRYGEHSSVLTPDSDVTMLDIHLDADGSAEMSIPAGASAFVMIIDGAVQLGEGAAAAALTPASAASFAIPQATSRLQIAATGEAARLVLFTGTPIRERIVFGGPFVMNTQEEIGAAQRRFHAGKMGRLEPSATG